MTAPTELHVHTCGPPLRDLASRYRAAASLAPTWQHIMEVWERILQGHSFS